MQITPRKQSNLGDTVESDQHQRFNHFMKNNPIGVLSSVGPNGDPHGAVVYYAIDNAFNASILTKSGTKKSDNLLHHDHVMLTIYEPLTQTTMQLSGRASVITDRKRINEVAQANYTASLATSMDGVPAILKLDAGDYIAFEIKPVSLRMAVYARPDSGEYSELFETITDFE